MSLHVLTGLLVAPSLSLSRQICVPPALERPQQGTYIIGFSLPQTKMEAPRTPLQDLVPFPQAFWELPLLA